MSTGAKWLVWGGAGVAVFLVLAVLIGGVVSGQQAAGPEVQSDFLRAVKTGQDEKTENDTQVVRAKDRRGEAICEMLPASLKVEDWTGKLTMVSTELGGDQALVEIEIAEGVKIEADEGAFDSGIDPDSEVFEQVASLSEGQSVRFAGSFQDGDYCIDEGSMMSENGLRTPTFSFSFTSIEAD